MAGQKVEEWRTGLFVGSAREIPSAGACRIVRICIEVVKKHHRPIRYPDRIRPRDREIIAA